MNRIIASLRNIRTAGQPHFVRDYEKLVRWLVRSKPIDEAMSVAVGGDYYKTGAVECDIVQWAGLRDGMAIIDFGCGSGRLAQALGKRCNVDYTGIDVVQSLLDYAKTKCPPKYRFVKSQKLDLPLPDSSADMIACFSVFTHLMPSESYLYLKDMRRVLRPGGRLVLSFLEFANPDHWQPFEVQIAGALHPAGALHLNMLIERSVLDLWCRKLGLIRETFVDGDAHPWGDSPIGQSVAIIRNEK